MADTLNNFFEPLLKKCGQISLARQSKFYTIKKGDIKGYTTDVDREIGVYIYKRISTIHPTASIECEDGPLLKTGSDQYIWYIDPLDGTTNYIHKLPFFAISISCYDKQNSRFLASGIYVPYFNQLFTTYGKGTPTLNGKKIKVSDFKNLKDSLILTGMSFKVKENGKEIETFIKITSGISAGTRRSGSAALDLCYVAAGFADAYYHFNLKPWDIAAGAHLVINAGGKVSNINNSKLLDLCDGTILATNGLLHKKLGAVLIKNINS